jgi:uncharacterized repeat protein (TIGR02543 family)
VEKLITARAAAPSGVTTSNASSTVANNGGIALTGSFEYRAHRDASQSGGWATTVNSTAVTYGNYDVRRAATDTVFASTAVTVNVAITGASTVTYAAGGGIGSQTQTGGDAGDTNAFYDGAAIPVLGPGTLSRAGYTFAGWTVSPAVNFNGTANTTVIPAADAGVGKTFIIAANTTLTAKWEKKPTVVSVSPVGANAQISGEVTIVFSDEMAATKGVVQLNSITLDASTGYWDTGDATHKTYKIPYSGLAYSTAYTYTISGFAKAVVPQPVMDSVSTFSLTTMADPNRTITAVAQYGGHDGKDRSTGILVTFNEAVTAPPASAFAVTGTGVTGTTTVTDGDDGEATTWVIGVTGTWVNRASDITVAVADWGEFVVTNPGAQTVPAMYAPQKEPTPEAVINYVDETLEKLIVLATYRYSGTGLGTDTFTVPIGGTYPIDSHWLATPDFTLVRVGSACDPAFTAI